MNLFEEGQFAISLLLQLVDGSLLMFVIFSLSAARGGSRSGSHPPPVTSFTSAGTPDRSVHGAGVGHTKTNP